MPQERLDKLISSNGALSRKEAAKLISAGSVYVNGKKIKNAAQKADPDNDEIIISGKKFDFKKRIYLMLNKPKGVVSASEGKGEKTVVDLVPDSLKRSGLFPAGRLDKDTTGFVLITDDGAFAHKILSPKNHIDKTYFVTLKKELSNESVKVIEVGLELHDGTKFLPSKISPLSPDTCEITICEGKYHQIKRMFKAAGNEVIDLKRIRMGDLPLDPDLAEGETRELTKPELNLIEQKNNNY